MKYLIIVFCLFGFVLACKPGLLIPVEKDVQRAQERWHDMDLQTLKNAHKLYLLKCGKCHYTYNPTNYSEEAWLKRMPDMKREAKLDSAEFKLLTKYVLTMREASKSSNNER